MNKLVIRSLKWHYSRLWKNKMRPGKITNWKKLPCGKWQLREGLTKSSTSMTNNHEVIGGFAHNFSITRAYEMDEGKRKWKMTMIKNLP
jgi:hypothetical protein